MDRRLQVCLLFLLGLELCVSNTGTRDTLASGSESSMFFYQDQMYPRDCKEVQEQCSNQDATGVHLIRPDGIHEPFWVSCSDGWTIIQRRMDGSLDFNRSWAEYRDGFGYLNVEHWLGNEKLSQLTNQKTYELLIEIETESGLTAHISYDKFRINDGFSDYSLVSLGQRNGTSDSEFFDCLSDNPACNKDCYDIQLSDGNANSEDYQITPTGWTRGAITVNCNMTIDEGGWTVIQRRIQSSSRLSFDRNWAMYQSGFGTSSGEFWIGLEQLYYLTKQKDYELRIDMVNADHSSYYAKYDYFRINGESDKYRLIGLGDMTGTAAFDAMRYHQGSFFSTPDQDNDLYQTPTYNCADNADGGWWYYQCRYCNLNYGSSSSYVGNWRYLPGSDDVLYTEMKIRPKKAN